MRRELVLNPRIISKHRYKRHRSKEWYEKLAEKKILRREEWRKTASPIDIALFDAIGAMHANLSADIYGDRCSDPISKNP